MGCFDQGAPLNSIFFNVAQVDIRGREIFCDVTPCNDGSQSGHYNLLGLLLVEEIVATFVFRDHNSSAAKFHIQLRLESEIEANGESRHLGWIVEHPWLAKIDIGKAGILLVVVPGGFSLPL